jgi:imidazolonepropionase-like amidohydrolase
MRHSRFLLLLAVFWLAFGAAAAAAGSGQVGPTCAIRNVKIVPVAGPSLDKGVIVIRDGLIEAVGPADKVAIPEDAEVIEGEGLTAYPGLISGHTNLFLEEPRPAQPQAAADISPAAAAATQPSPPDEPNLLVFKQLKPKRATIDAYLKVGITTVLVAPPRGIFQGQSVLLNLNGEEPEPMVIRNPVALHINFTTARGSYPSSLMGTIAYIRQKFLDADYWATAQAVYAKNLKGMKRPVYDPFAEALVPFLRDKKPVVFQCNDLEDIKRALKIIDEFKLNALLSQANEAWRDAEVLKKTRLPLLVTLDFRPPRGSQYVTQGEDLRKKAEAEIYPANPANLARSGLKFALTSLGLADAAAFVKAVQAAIKAGLSREDALRALTIHPAEYLGLAAQLGSIEAGKIANIILAKGDLFDEKTQITRVFVDGVLTKF